MDGTEQPLLGRDLVPSSRILGPSPLRRAQHRAAMPHSGSPLTSSGHTSSASGLRVTAPSLTPHPSKRNSPCSPSRAAAKGGGRAGRPRHGGIAFTADGVVRLVAAMKGPTSRSNCCASRRPFAGRPRRSTPTRSRSMRGGSGNTIFRSRALDPRHHGHDPRSTPRVRRQRPVTCGAVDHAEFRSPQVLVLQ